MTVDRPQSNLRPRSSTNHADRQTPVSTDAMHVAESFARFDT
ncbi:hypothetical protein [Haloprofundus halobius]|nr:hypothetical protein [Haloprofundus halobius]